MGRRYLGEILEVRRLAEVGRRRRGDFMRCPGRRRRGPRRIADFRLRLGRCGDCSTGVGHLRRPLLAGNALPRDPRDTLADMRGPWAGRSKCGEQLPAAVLDIEQQRHRSGQQHEYRDIGGKQPGHAARRPGIAGIAPGRWHVRRRAATMATSDRPALSGASASLKSNALATASSLGSSRKASSRAISSRLGRGCSVVRLARPRTMAPNAAIAPAKLSAIGAIICGPKPTGRAYASPDHAAARGGAVAHPTAD